MRKALVVVSVSSVSMHHERIDVWVDRARQRLAWLHVVGAVRAGVGAIALSAAGLTILRPFLWPLHDAPAGRAAARALLLGATGALAALVVVVGRAWRGRPGALGAARRLDEALDQRELVASAYAFERDRRSDPMAALAIDRARRVLHGVAIAGVLRPVRTPPRRSTFIGLGVLLVAGAFGAIDRLVVERMMHPMSAREAAAARELARVADAAAPGAGGARDPKADALVDAARKASAAAERGDRKRALEALEEMRKASRAVDAQAKAEARSLRALRDEASRGAERSTGASQALARLENDIDAGDPGKVAERLAKSEAAAREAAGGGSPGWSRTAEALAEARAALARGDKASAKRAIERASKETAAMEKERSSAESLASVAEGGAELDRSLHEGLAKGPRAAGEERPGGKGERGERGERGEKADGSGSVMTKPGEANEPGGAGKGRGESRHTLGQEGRRAPVDGDLQARVDVRPGEKAVSAIEGMGRGDDPRAFKEIFPSYDTVVEDGLRDDAVPAARRPTVRRYFSSIRPEK